MSKAHLCISALPIERSRNIQGNEGIGVKRAVIVRPLPSFLIVYCMLIVFARLHNKLNRVNELIGTFWKHPRFAIRFQVPAHASPFFP